MRLIILIMLVLLLTPYPVATIPNMEYVVQNGENCELIAKYYQEKYDTELYIIMPLKDNGALDLGARTGHIINSKIIDGHRYFFDFNEPQGNYIFTSEGQVMSWYYNHQGKKSEIFNTQNTPFHMIWNYP